MFRIVCFCLYLRPLFHLLMRTLCRIDVMVFDIFMEKSYYCRIKKNQGIHKIECWTIYYTFRILIILTYTFNSVSSSCGSDAHRCVHPAVAEWREELWCATQQTILCEGAHGYTSVHWHTRRFPYHCESVHLSCLWVCQSVCLLVSLSVCLLT